MQMLKKHHYTSLGMSNQAKMQLSKLLFPKQWKTANNTTDPKIAVAKSMIVMYKCVDCDIF